MQVIFISFELSSIIFSCFFLLQGIVLAIIGRFQILPNHSPGFIEHFISLCSNEQWMDTMNKKIIKTNSSKGKVYNWVILWSETLSAKPYLCFQGCKCIALCETIHRLVLYPNEVLWWSKSKEVNYELTTTTLEKIIRLLSGSHPYDELHTALCCSLIFTYTFFTWTIMALPYSSLNLIKFWKWIIVFHGLQLNYTEKNPHKSWNHLLLDWTSQPVRSKTVLQHRYENFCNQLS